MSDQYRPLIGSDKGFPLAPTSTSRMEDLARLRLRAPYVGDETRQQIAKNYGYSSPHDAVEEFGEGTLTPPEFHEQVATVVFQNLTQEHITQNEVDFAEVRRALGKFTQAGNEELAALMSALNASQNSANTGGNPTGTPQAG